MPRLRNLPDAIIEGSECGRVECTASRANVFTLKFFCKGIGVENVFVPITEGSREIRTCVGENGYVW